MLNLTGTTNSTTKKRGLQRTLLDSIRHKKTENPLQSGIFGFYRFLSNLCLVQMERLELSRPKAPPPQGGASTNSATSALNFLNYIFY